VRKLHQDADFSSILSKAYIHNGLESKISLDTYKVHYVEETEDMFIRKRKMPRLDHSSKYKNSAAIFRKRMRSEGH
jgi:hypothetical protein